jgi:hypothetical protein
MGGDPRRIFEPWSRPFPTEDNDNLDIRRRDPSRELRRVFEVARKKCVVTGTYDAATVGDRPGGHHQLVVFDLSARAEDNTMGLDVSAGNSACYYFDPRCRKQASEGDHWWRRTPSRDAD